MPKYDYPIPIVRIIVPDQANRVLLLRRSKTTHAAGEWCLPGGKIDYGLTAIQACQLELMQETGMRSDRFDFLFYQDSLAPAPGQMHCINLYFKCMALGSVTLNAESSEYAWVGPDNMTDYPIAFRNSEALIRYWQEF
jgi:8-oxo-dGTP diphosphatase